MRGGGFVEFGGGGLNDELSAFGHGVTGINREIHQHLVHHAPVGMDEQLLHRKFELQMDVVAECAPQHFGQLVDGFVQIQFSKLQCFFPAEQKQLAGQRGGALCGRADLLGKFRLRRRKATFCF